MKKKHNSPFIYSEGFKRYYTLDWHFKNKYGKKVCKVVLASGMSCPNRDGTRGVGGCTFCSGSGGGEFSPSARIPLLKQFEDGKKIMINKWKDCGFIAYFQAFTNTHATIQSIQNMLEEALTLPQILEIRIATRPDCLDREKVVLLAKINQIIPVSIEMGLQSIHDSTAKAINRCHTFEEFLKSYQLLCEYKIDVCVHLINGLPQETSEMMLVSAKVVGALNPHGIKIHMLHLVRGSKMCEDYIRAPFPLLTQEEYVNITCDQLEYIPKNTVIERLTGDGSPETLLEPQWTKKKLTVINDIDKELFSRDSFQGMKTELFQQKTFYNNL